jgi:hypothetical protein
MKRAFKPPKKAVPQFLPFTEDAYNKFNGSWLIWRAVERKPTEFLAAMQMPVDLWNFLIEMDSVFSILERQQSDSGNASAPPLDNVTKKAKRR